MKNLTLVSKQGDVSFYENEKGVLYQQLGNDTPYKVRDGSMTYKHITKVNEYDIKYNNNGVQGFSIWKGRVCLEDRFWVYEEALRAVYQM